MTEIERVSTGVPGLDELVEGGLPQGSVTLVSGGAGCGKTILSSQFLWDGLENGEKARFISLEEPVDDIKNDMKVFGWDLEKYEESGDFKITYIQPAAGERKFIQKINDLASEEGVSRLVIDSVSIMLGAYGGDESKKRDNMYDLIRNIKRSDATTVLTSEIPEDAEGSLSRYGVAEFVADGVVVLYYESVGEGTFRNIEVRKMRRTAHTPGTYPMKITDNGIRVESETL
ncbi:MAG: ATPase domain-containing protein [Candidatus Nanohaloarchaea archaeon]|nr:ATPase domain-containing protein [Candidatus Nanohaloarchaea archaeon]